MESLEFEKKEKRYFIRGKHAAIICAAVIVTGVAVGLGVGLSQKTSSSEDETKPTPTPSPTTPPDNRGPCKPSDNTDGGWNNFRLPDYMVPSHYDLHLEPDLNTDTYTGSVSIHLTLTQPSQHLWLHIRETFVTAVPTLQRSGPSGLTSVRVKECFEYTPQEYVVVEVAEQLSVTGTGEHYVLTLHFQGWLNGSLVGFYRTTYQENEVTKKIAATDHEPTDARKSFPCFDEPNKKATYTISITHDSGYEALSNMPVENTEKMSDEKTKTSFKKSVKMSTYLVCFAVHQFRYVERTSKRGIPLRIYAQPLQISTTEYAANVTKIIFDYFEEYFDMDYSIEKLDKIAIPDFGTGAMENWGLITYRETNLLFDEKESSSINKQRVASVIAHELVHQWFGNIVTMDWWDDLWLNEGFASFFEYVGVEQAETDWGMRDIMLINDVFPVMVDDALLSSHPIIVDVSSPAEITSVFDAISYNKGASILRMLEDLLGRDKFRDGCRQYLKNFLFQNAKTADFWKAMEDESGLPVADIMDTWTKQMGYPVLNLTITDTEAKLIQNRFLLDPNADPSQPTTPLGYKWTIPVKWSTLNSKNNSFLFDKTEDVIAGYSPATDGLIKVNKDHMGFYRVNHHDSVWSTIAEQLFTDYKVYDATDRSSYIDDVFAFGRADIVNYGNAFNLTRYLANETEYIVWDRVSTSISYVRDMLADDPVLYPKFQKLFRDHVQKISRELGWNDEGTQTERLLRETILGLACQMSDQEALNQASEIFNKWIDGTISSVAVNLRLLVYRYGMRNSKSERSWEIMFQKYLSASLAQEKDKLLYGLASVENVTLLHRLLEAAKNESIVRSQDVFSLVQYVSRNTYGKTMAWEWMTLNWDYLVNRYSINDRNLGRLPSRITSAYNTELLLWKMEHFFALNPNAGAGEMPRKQALETVKNNIEWMRRNQEEIRVWLENNVSD
ncbi:glutamyl aminopeptidase [Rhinichthys klamathensis goyatoka]|uniref:glutamyl aminopeptidase n=1 Tax=Rhinichthys klamathensis goyatoka TaxID=3034132 RepID=UPI0024B61F29|nr:glutamyl aminopeptidase [Rhinichthys klamathensis goyatoka]XP_056125020.1 glutamyl aminopeptidase [Rhinichthys klamathensis goyatoka]XP_056125021.1 glutamyl aminopeptidase [Rhinichthys klamathensis goyatoka]